MTLWNRIFDFISNFISYFTALCFANAELENCASTRGNHTRHATRVGPGQQARKNQANHENQANLSQAKRGRYIPARPGPGRQARPDELSTHARQVRQGSVQARRAGQSRQASQAGQVSRHAKQVHALANFGLGA